MGVLDIFFNILLVIYLYIYNLTMKNRNIAQDFLDSYWTPQKIRPKDTKNNLESKTYNISL